MERVNQIFFHPKYQAYFHEIQRLEADREFCGHTIEHFLDVARLAYILVIEEGLVVGKEVIYAAALLHDIGRYLEYTKEVPHEEGSAMLARELLPECGFSKEEQAFIIEAILEHRENPETGTFSGILYRADKLSRNCFSCPAEESCRWPEEKKNVRLQL